MSGIKKWFTLDKNEESKSADSMLSPLSLNQRRSTASIVAVAVGWAFALTGMIAGGAIAPAMDINDIIVSIIIGNAALFVISLSISFIAFKTGCSTPLIFRFVFGKSGMMLPSLLVVAVGLGWQASLTGMIPDTWVGSGITPLYIIIGLLAGILVVVTLFKGIKGIEIISWPAVFFIVVVGIISIVKGYSHLGGMTGIETAARDLASTHTLSVSNRVDLIIGAWIVGAVFAGDFTRFARNKLAVFLFVAIAFLVTQPFLNTVGILGVLAFDNYNPVGYVGSVGSMMWFLVAIGITIAIWTTANNNFYFTQVATSNVFKLPKITAVIIIGLIGGVAGALGVFNYVDSFIGLLAAFVPPVLGPILVDFYFFSKMKFDVKLLDKVPDYNIPAICAYIVGVAIPFIYTPTVLPAAIWGIIISILMYTLIYIVYKYLGKKFGYMLAAESLSLANQPSVDKLS